MPQKCERYSAEKNEGKVVLNRLNKALICLWHNILPIKKKVIMFSSFYGQYNDNPKAIERAVRKKCPFAKIVWVRSTKSKESFLADAEIVEMGSKEYYKYSYRAQVVVDNHMGLRASAYWGDKGLKKLPAKIFSRKRRGQLCISTWHGTPLKKIAADVKKDTVFKKHYTNSDYVVAGCELTKRALESGFLHSIPVKMYGTPRNDVLLKPLWSITEIKQKLGLPLDKKIILYAPTFRDDVMQSGVNQMAQLNFERLFANLHGKFGGDWCFVFRVHNMVLRQIDTEKISQKYGNRLINGNLGDDMADYLQCADVLISDYSGAIFDFALTKKPCFLFSPDREHYEKQERGFYIDYDQLPFPLAITPTELENKILKFDDQQYKENVEDFLNEIGNIEDGFAAERVAEDIYNFITNKRR